MSESPLERTEVLKMIYYDDFLYSIVCALRGPDLTNSEPLKDVFTWPIRWICSGCVDPIKKILDLIKPGNVTTIIYSLPLFEGNIKHYLTHVYSAYRSFHKIGVIPQDVFEYVRECIETVKKISEILESKPFKDIDVDSYTEPIVRLYKDLCEKYKVNERG